MNEAREQELIRAAKENEAAKAADVENLKEKYSGTDEKIYTVTTTVQVDDDTEEERALSLTTSLRSRRMSSRRPWRNTRQSLSALRTSCSVCLGLRTLHP